MIDVLENKINELKVLDKGFVRLVDCMPRLTLSGTADEAIVQAARVSYGAGTKTVGEDSTLIRYLVRNLHTSPLEQVEFKFHMKMPIFVARQIVRSRTASLNEYSGRYSEIKDEYYIPEIENIRQQSLSNKQGGEIPINPSDAECVRGDIVEHCKKSYVLYNLLLKDGVSREQARMILPINFYTEWYWKMDLHNLLHFIALRSDHHAQWETRQYSDTILSLIKPIVPIAVDAWEDYHPLRGAMKLTALEVDAIQNLCLFNQVDANDPDIVCGNKRERDEWKEKILKFQK